MGKTEGTINLFFWAIVIFGIGFYLQHRLNVNSFLVLTLIPIWLLVSFIIDIKLGLTDLEGN